MHRKLDKAMNAASRASKEVSRACDQYKASVENDTDDIGLDDVGDFLDAFIREAERAAKIMAKARIDAELEEHLRHAHIEDLVSHPQNNNKNSRDDPRFPRDRAHRERRTQRLRWSNHR